MRRYRRFAAAKNRVIMVFAAVAFISVCLPLCFASFSEGGWRIAGFFAFAAACLALIYLMLRRYYEFRKDELFYVFGPVTSRFAYSRITHVRYAGRIWGQGAARYAVYELGELKVLVSPADSRGFLSEMKKRCKNAVFEV